MKKLTKYALLLLSVACLSISASACSCNGDTSDSSSGDPTTEQKADLSVQQNLILKLGDEQRLVPDYKEIEGATLSYSSSNPAVAEISSDGLVQAMGEGTATITVSYAGEQVTCAVSVSVGTLRPTFAFDQLDKNEIVLSKEDRFNLSSYVSFNGKTFRDGTVEFTVADATVAKVENGVLIPLKKGKTTVNAVAAWRGLTGPTMEYTFSVSVTDNVSIYVNDGLKSEFTLYTTESFGGQNFETQTPFVVNAFDGETQLDGTVEIVEGAEFVSYANGTLHAVGFGESRIKISCTSDGDEYAQFINVSVKKPLLVYDTAIDFDATDATLPLTAIFGKETELVDVIDYSGEELTLSENKITGFKITRAKPEPRRVDVYDAEGGYTLTLTPYTKVIRKAEDLSFFNLSSKDVNFDGYYTLANNIDASGYSHSHANTRPSVLNGFRNNSTTIVGLTGIFDGRGYIIDGITLGQYGLFGKITSGTVKNVAFTNVQFREEEMTATLAACLENSGENSRLENVYIQAEKLPTGERSGLVFWMWNPYYTEWNNVVVETPDVSEAAGTVSYTIVSSIADANLAPNLSPLPSNVYVISPTLCNLYGGNDTGAKPATPLASDASNQENAKNFYKTWKRYETYGEWKEAIKQSSITGFDSEYWTFTDGVPTWKGVEIDTNVYQATVNGEACTEATLWEGDTAELALLVNGEAQTDVTFDVADESVLSIDGTTVTAISMGTTTVTATCALYTAIFEIAVQPVGEEITYATQLLLDTTDGLLYNAETGEIVALDSIFGGTRVVAAMDKISGDTLSIVNGKLSGYTVEEMGATEEKSVILRTADKFTEVSILPCTKVIDEASDLEIFKWSNQFLSFDGYYALAKNIDASAYTHDHGSSLLYNQVKNILQTGRFTNSQDDWSHNGLTGVFDGRGYTISGITVGDFGLFGAISGGVVKNVGFTNVQFTRGQMACLLAASTRSNEKDEQKATLQNVYMQANELPTGDDSGLLCWAVSLYTVMQNVIVVTPDTSETVGSLVKTEFRWNATPMAENRNVYIVSPNKLAYFDKYGSSSHPYEAKVSDAGNQAEAATVYSYIKRYDTETAMKADNNDYSLFDSAYWTVTAGEIPVWKTK